MEKPTRKPLVSVERQFETDLATGRTQVRMFVKMYFEARDSGLLADIGDHRWRTLCCLATYMNADGRCCPSQARIAEDLGISRQQVNRRLGDLADYRFHGRPVLRIEKTRRDTAKGGRWANNVYFIQPISGLGIFADRQASEGEERPSPPVSHACDTGEPVSAARDSGAADSNKSQHSNQNHTQETVCAVGVREGETERDPGAAAERLVRRFHDCRGHAQGRGPSSRELDQARELIRAHGAHRAGYILAFALHQAESTRFAMQTFGAVLQYVPDALEAFRRDRTRTNRQVRASREDLFESWRRESVDRARQEMDGAELEELNAAVRTELAGEWDGEGDLGFDLLCRARVDALIASRIDVSEQAFEEHVARTRPDRGRKAS